MAYGPPAGPRPKGAKPSRHPPNGARIPRLLPRGLHRGPDARQRLHRRADAGPGPRWARRPQRRNAGQLKFFGQHAHHAERKAFAAYLAPLRKRKWYVYSKPPFGGPAAVLAPRSWRPSGSAAMPVRWKSSLVSSTSPLGALGDGDGDAVVPLAQSSQTRGPQKNRPQPVASSTARGPACASAFSPDGS
jgi:hypothetical protein